MMETTSPSHKSHKPLFDVTTTIKEHRPLDSTEVALPSQASPTVSVDSTTSTVSTVSNTSPSSPTTKTFNDDYDNLGPDRKSDILNDLPILPKTNLGARTSSQSGTSNISDDADTQSQLSSVESLLSAEGSGLSLGSGSPVDLPNTVHEEVDDDAWLNQFGKDNNSSMKRRSLSSSDVKQDFPDTFTYPTRKKKNSSFSRLETTSYSFSIGGGGSKNETKDDELLADAIAVTVGKTNTSGEVESSVWVKRDSKQRVPVRKLKPVSIKSSTVVSSLPNRQKSPELSPSTLKSTPFSLDENKVSDIEQNNDQIDGLDKTKDISKSPSLQKSRSLSNTSHDSNQDSGPGSPTRLGPATLPKPKKGLDKKSWTADLIKSKSQAIPEQPQPGSLNDKLLQKRKTDEQKPDENRVVTRTPSLNNKSIKEIRTKFQTTPSFKEPGTVGEEKQGVSIEEDNSNIDNNSSKEANQEKYV